MSNRKEPQHTMIYHTDIEAKRSFKREIRKVFPTFSAFARLLVERGAEYVFNPEIWKKK